MNDKARRFPAPPPDLEAAFPLQNRDWRTWIVGKRGRKRFRVLPTMRRP